MSTYRKKAGEIPEVFERLVVAPMLDEISGAFADNERDEIEQEIADYLDACSHLGPDAMEFAKAIVAQTLERGITLMKSADALADLMGDDFSSFSPTG